ncbi:hypothetical protein DFJ43DRAFT_116545 [Lentinula guzmanii]|uniref:Uncharacterized protein n=1 Tax=Lentinula guzmanii TaxID=2804957 RepID=A0AA38JDK3_9AGAR|nr:hypothetical protein DFJ43DRAFT_116545 [Lentinula guzmanii]
MTLINALRYARPTATMFSVVQIQILCAVCISWTRNFCLATGPRYFLSLFLCARRAKSRGLPQSSHLLPRTLSLTHSYRLAHEFIPRANQTIVRVLYAYAAHHRRRRIQNLYPSLFVFDMISFSGFCRVFTSSGIFIIRSIFFTKQLHEAPRFLIDFLGNVLLTNGVVLG